MAPRARAARDAALRAFAERGWAEAARAKAEYWAVWSRRHTTQEAWAMIEEARSAASARHTGGPQPAELENTSAACDSLRRAGPKYAALLTLLAPMMRRPRRG